MLSSKFSLFYESEESVINFPNGLPLTALSLIYFKGQKGKIFMYSIYKHTAPNGKVYIGQTKLPLYKRWVNGSGYSNQTVFYKDILAFGWDNIKHEVLEEVATKEEAKERERYYILKYRSNEPEYGYNKNTNFFSCASPEEIDKYKNQYKYSKRANHQVVYNKLICIETGEEFLTYTEAGEAYGIDISSICKAAKGIRKSAGKHPITGEKLHWEIL